MGKIDDIDFPWIGERDGAGGHAAKGVHSPVGQRGEEIVQRAQLHGGAFVFDDERVTVGRVDAIPHVAVADRAMKPGGEVAAGADNPPRATPHFAGVMHLLAGRRVAAQVDICWEARALYLECLRAGFVYLPLNTGYQKGELAYFFSDAEPRVIVCRPESAQTVAAIRPQSSCVR